MTQMAQQQMTSMAPMQMAQPGTCQQSPGSGFLFQGALLLAAICVLVPKKLREGDERTWAEFLLDASKQLLGAGWLLLVSDVFSDDDDPKVDDCTLYWSTISLSTTLGVFISYALLNAVTTVLENGTGQTGDFLTGEYVDEDDELVPRKYAKQLLVWIGCVTVMKLQMVILFSCISSFWTSIVEVLLGCVSWNPQVEYAFVMVLSPTCMLAFQFWVTDDFIKRGGLPFAVFKEMVQEAANRMAAKAQGKPHARVHILDRRVDVTTTNRVFEDTKANGFIYEGANANGFTEPLLTSDASGSDCESPSPERDGRSQHDFNAGRPPRNYDAEHHGEHHSNYDGEHLSSYVVESPGDSPERYGSSAHPSVGHSSPDPRVGHLERQLAAERRERNMLLAAERQALQQQLAEERLIADELFEKEQRAMEEARKHERELLDLHGALRKHHELASEDAAERQGLRNQVAELTEQRARLEEETAQNQERLARSREMESQLRAKVAHLTENSSPGRSDPPSPVQAVSASETTTTTPEAASHPEACRALVAHDSTRSPSKVDIVVLSKEQLARLTPEQTVNAASQRGVVLDRKLGSLEAKLQGLGNKSGSLSGHNTEYLTGALEAKILGHANHASVHGRSHGLRSGGLSVVGSHGAAKGHAEEQHPVAWHRPDVLAHRSDHRKAEAITVTTTKPHPYLDIAEVENEPPGSAARGLDGLEDLLRIQRQV